jgi:murein DD-endopeptidase MepM/ murein hydrolase activator NlpD
MPITTLSAFSPKAGRFMLACMYGSACSAVILGSWYAHAPANVKQDEPAPPMSLRQSAAPAPNTVAAKPPVFVGPPAPVRVADSATIEHTFSQAAESLGLDQGTIGTLTQAFANKVDLTRDLRKGDTLSIVYDEPKGADVRGQPLAVRLTTGDASHDVFLHSRLDGKPLYYSKDGESTEPSFLRYPIQFTRVSSEFALRRLDPVTHRWQSHDGVDLAAPIGTPVHATAQGTVEFAGRQTGYGKVIMLKNPPPYSTVYAHLSRFAKGVREGMTVKRGQVIGYVGETGWATGPHLHYEVHVADVAMNPLTVTLPTDDHLHGTERQRFAKQAEKLRALL